MGFEMGEIDRRFLKYGDLFEDRIMDLEVNLPLEQALDTCWQILGECFQPRETGIDPDLCEKFWPKQAAPAS
jgi:V/A-type H+-transporting ATPase subunit B